MVGTTDAQRLADTIAKLKEDRQKHEQAIHEINEVFRRFGIDPDAVASANNGPRRRGRPPKAAASTPAAEEPASRRRRRRRTGVSGELFVLQFIHGKGEATTREINEAWERDGRGGAAGNALTKLTAEGKLKRMPLEGKKGSIYSVTDKAEVG